MADLMDKYLTMDVSGGSPDGGNASSDMPSLDKYLTMDIMPSPPPADDIAKMGMAELDKQFPETDVPPQEGTAEYAAMLRRAELRKQPELTAGEKIKGAAETALAVGTGATSGMAGQAVGAVKGIGESILSGDFGTQKGAQHAEETAANMAAGLTYAPKTVAGQQMTRAVGEVVADLPALAALPETQMIARLGRGAVEAGQIPTVGDAVGAIKNKFRQQEPPSQPPPGSVGAAGVGQETLRQRMAEILPDDAQLTKGQATRDFEQLRFEQEAAKDAEMGSAIRQRYASQHAAVRQRLDGWIDDTGAGASNEVAAGSKIESAIKSKMANDKNRVRAAYKNAEKAGELEAPVKTDSLSKMLAELEPAESTASVISAARKELARLGGESGEMTLGNMEQLRKFVNKTTGTDPTNIKFAGDIKRAIDTATDGVGGKAYKQARALRAKMADQYENKSIISDIINTKRGSDDRRVALENITSRILLRSSADDLKFAGSLIKRADRDAWAEVQASALKYIQNEATKGVSTDSYGNPVIGTGGLVKAIKMMDENGKLDYLFGDRNAEKLRAIGELAQVMFTAPPGVINTSNTASVLAASIDMMLSGASGVPAPIASGIRMLSKNIRDRKTRARINDALLGNRG